MPLFGVLSLLVARFDEEDLRPLCLELGLDSDDLPTQGRSNRSRELVRYLARRERIADLSPPGAGYVQTPVGTTASGAWRDSP